MNETRNIVPDVVGVNSVAMTAATLQANYIRHFFLEVDMRGMTVENIIGTLQNCINDLETDDQKIDAINKIKIAMHEISPFKNEPVDCVLWVKNTEVKANDYNPNTVAPPEMKLLEVSIVEDGYTQPIVTWKEQDKMQFEVVDGFHRNRVGKESPVVSDRIKGYLPIVHLRESQTGKNDRIAATIRHNRARGKHRVDAMSDIVVELKRRNWSDDKIARNLGMDQDEILRLCQITGLSEMFADKQFSKSWDIEGHVDTSDFDQLTDDPEAYQEETESFRTVNTSDEDRIFHTFNKWECHKAGLYNTTFEGKTKSECEESYREFLSNITLFEEYLEKVITEWKHSCEHYLTNKSMNRIAWLGQASMCRYSGIPSAFRSGFCLLSKDQQKIADLTALKYLNKWLTNNGRKEVALEEAYSNGDSDLY